MKVLKREINVSRDDNRISIKLNCKYDITEKYFIYIYIYVGPNNLWSWPIYSLGPKARVEEGYGPGSGNTSTR